MFDAKGPMAFANRDVDLLVIEGFLNSRLLLGSCVNSAAVSTSNWDTP